MFLSIIVPVFNASPYLARCVESLLHQGLDDGDYEIILVNDGSTDNSLDICRDYARRYSQIKVVDKENGGVASARNMGIDEALGVFLCFVDADDYVLENGYGYIKNHYDCLNHDMIRFWIALEVEGSSRPKVIEGKIAFEGTGHDYIVAYGLDSYCVASFFRVAFLREHNIRFSPYRVSEDTVFTSSVLLANPRMISTTSRIYRYVINPVSASNVREKEYMKKCVEDQLNAHGELMDRIAALNFDKNSTIYKHSIGFLRSLMPFFFSRVLSARLSVAEFRQVTARCHKHGSIPLPYYKQMSRKVRAYSHVINFLDRYPRLFPLASFLYAKIFVRYILKHIDRNRV